MPDLISIVLPTYNGSKYIRRSIESCLQQTYKNFELIIVNDCSTDNTPDIINEYAQLDNRIRVINNVTNKKLPLSLNAGFDAATGAYHTWTSDDNYYAPDALEVMHAEMEKDSSVGLVYTDYTLINEFDENLGITVFNDINKSFFKWNGCGACFLYRAEIYESNGGYNPAAFLIEDYDFFVRAYAKYDFKYLPVGNLYYYRVHPQSLTAQFAHDTFNIQKTVQEKHINILSPKIGEHETLLLYRKLAVYNSVHQNNVTKSIAYLKNIAVVNARMAVVTVLYIISKKLLVSLSVMLSLLRFLLTMPFRKKDI